MNNKYPYTDFNEYNMDWIIKTVKDLTESWKLMKTEWSDQQTEWENYKNYIDTYFENLDLQDEVNVAMTKLVESGQFTQIVRPFFEEAIADVPEIVSTWIDNNLLQETGYVIDKTLTVADAAADAFSVGEIIFKEKEELNDLLEPVITDDDWTIGAINSTTGEEVASTIQIRTGFMIIGSDVILKYRGITDTGRICYAYYYSKEKLFIQRNSIRIDPSPTPAGAYFVRLTYGFTSGDGRTVTGYGFANLLSDFKYMILNPWRYRYLYTDAAYDTEYSVTWELGTINTDGSDAVNASYIRCSGLLPAHDNLIIYNPEGYRVYIAGFDSGKFNNLSRFELTTNRYKFDRSVKYFRIALRTADTADITDGNNVKLTSGGVVQYEENQKWIAIGDSITEGRANPGGGDPSIDKYEHCFINVAAKLSGYNVYNIGDGGSGFLSRGSDSNYNLQEYIDNYTFSDADVITIAMGINDYITSKPLGSVADTTSANTCMAKLKYALAHLGGNGNAGSGQAGKARIVVLLPMNGNRDYPGNFLDTLDYNSNWYMNCRNNAGYTLKDMHDRIKDVCDFFGVEYIDLYEKGPLNRGNLKNLLGDGLHPTEEGHIKIGQALAHFFE